MTAWTTRRREPALRLVTASDEPSPCWVDPTKRGNHVVYRHGQTNFCPGCGRVNWWVGRLSAECAFCATAIDLERP